MSYIEITKNGIWAHEWDADGSEYISAKCIQPLNGLGFPCELQEGLTVCDLFKAVQEHSLLTDLISRYSQCQAIDQFHEEISKSKETDVFAAVGHAEIYRVSQIHDNEFGSWVDWHFVDIKAKCENCGREDWPDHGHFVSLSYTPLNEIAHLELKLNKNYIIRNMDKDEVIFKGTTEFTLLEVLHAIYYDISFHGGPKNRDVFVKKLHEDVKKIRSGEMKTLSADEVFGYSKEIKI